MTEKLKLTKNGVEEMLKELERKKIELQKLRLYKNQAAENEGDAWHDNFAFEQTEIKERTIMYEIRKIQNQIDTAEIIEDNISIDGIITIGSKIKLYMEYSDEDNEIKTFELTGGQGNINENKISINSPLGTCIFEQKVGFEGCYNVNGITIKVKVLDIN